jgi:RAB protein geranylgeranyltransferase component A
MSSSTNLSYNQFLLLKNQMLMAGQPDLPTDFEVIVVGTGFEESIIAAAVARNGHNILHIDTKDYYGDSWAAFNFNGLQTWMKSLNKDDQSPKPTEDDLKEFVNEGETVHLISSADNVITDVREEWFLKEDDYDKEDTIREEALEGIEPEEEGNKVPEEEPPVVPPPPPPPPPPPKVEQRRKTRWSKERLLEERTFNLDLMPRLLYSNGAMVDLLIQSNISRYTEFKAVSRVLTSLNGVLEYVPSSRADVFATKHISVVEKRILMKYLTFCLNYEEKPEAYAAYQEKSYLDFLKHEKLTDNLIHFVLHSIAMVDKKASCLEGLKATKKFLSSLGRFGNTPFLYSSFGSGELPQAFCRLCAVFGGTYYLGRSIEAIVTDNKSGKCIGIISDGKRINCQKLVMPGPKCSPDLRSVQPKCPSKVIERKICLTNDSILPSEKEHLTFLSVPPTAESGKSYTYVTEVGHGASVCPKGMYCLHMTKTYESEDLTIDKSLESVMTATKDKLIWSLDFKVNTECFEPACSEINSSLYLTTGPHFELDYDVTIARAKDIYKQMYPEEPFLPRAPNPEEIILGGETDPDPNHQDPEDNFDQANPEEEEEEKRENSSEEPKQQETMDNTST